MKASRFCAGVLVLGALAAWGGCSSSSGGDAGRGGFSDGSGAPGGSGGAPNEDSGAQGGAGAVSAGGAGGMAAGGAPAGGAGGAGGMGGSSTGGASAGGAGGGLPDADVPDVRFVYEPPDIMNVNPDAACATENATADPQRAPADIIFAVDNSGSMTDEARFVQTHMNNFSQSIVASGIDAHVILISADSTNGNGICIAAPLGSGSCPNDTNLPNYLHIANGVGSTNGLQIILNTYPQWQQALRPNAVKHVVIVTDDNSGLDAVSFDNAFRALDPTFVDYRFHGIYSFTGPIPILCGFTGNDPCCNYAAAEGTVYRQLVAMRMGVEGNLCLQDFGPVFAAISTTVVNTAPIDCDFALPQPQTGILDPDQVVLEIVPDTNNPANKFEVNNVGTQGQCGGGGWYYDNPAAPTRITLCPETCTQARMGLAPAINVLFGCLIG